MLSGPDGWSRRIEKAISFTGITACQAVNTHCFMCLQAKMEQLSLFIRQPRHAHTHSCARTHTHTVHLQREEGSNNDQLKSVIHYCQVHLTLSLLKTGIIGRRRSKNLINKQLSLLTFGINRHFPTLTFSSVIMYQIKLQITQFTFNLHTLLFANRNCSEVGIYTNHSASIYLCCRLCLDLYHKAVSIVFLMSVNA